MVIVCFQRMRHVLKRTEMTKIPGIKMVTEFANDFMHLVHGGVLIDFADVIADEPEVGFVKQRTKKGMELMKQIDEVMECK